jgi:hypothetical protein
MSFGGRGSSYQWQKGTTGRDVPPRLEMPYDQLVRGLIGQMAQPPETAISTPLQQAISNLQSGDVGRAYGLGGGIASRLSGAADTAPDSTGSGGASAPGFKPGSFLPGAAGGQQGLQTREQLGLPSRESYFPFMPTKEDIEGIGMAPVRSQVKARTDLQKQIDRLQTKVNTREALGKPHEQATKKLAKAQTKLGATTKGPTYRP